MDQLGTIYLLVTILYHACLVLGSMLSVFLIKYSYSSMPIAFVALADKVIAQGSIDSFRQISSLDSKPKTPPT